jgi:hypothetical protein
MDPPTLQELAQYKLIQNPNAEEFRQQCKDMTGKLLLECNAVCHGEILGVFERKEARARYPSGGGNNQAALDNRYLNLMLRNHIIIAEEMGYKFISQ